MCALNLMNEAQTTEQHAYKFPWFTLNLALVCVAIFFAVNTPTNFGPISQETYTYAGAPFALDIYRGQYWGVITNSFVHVLWYHLLINIVGLFLFGAFAERRLSWQQLFLFGLLASFVTSSFQLAFSDDAGIGLSGVNYALFGFIFVKSKNDSRFQVRLKFGMFMVMLVILLICFYMNYLANWNIKIISMITGFFWGMLLGSYLEYKTKLFTGTAIVLVLAFAVSSLFYAPWSAEWQTYKGVTLHEAGKLNEAERYYRRAIEIDAAHPLATENLKLIEIDQLSTKAYEAHFNGQYAKARRYYLEILRLDKKNTWARKNLSELP